MVCNDWNIQDRDRATEADRMDRRRQTDRQADRQTGILADVYQKGFKKGSARQGDTARAATLRQFGSFWRAN